MNESQDCPKIPREPIDNDNDNNSNNNMDIYTGIDTSTSNAVINMCPASLGPEIYLKVDRKHKQKGNDDDKDNDDYGDNDDDCCDNC